MYREIVKKSFFVVLCVIILSTMSCREKKGTLIFTANGEEFIVEGLQSKEGYAITFDQVLVNIHSPEAYNLNEKGLSAEVDGSQLIDLKKGSADAPAVSVHVLKNIPAGNYQSLKYSLKQIETGEYAGFSIVIKGSASKQNQTIPFIIKLNEELTFDGREGYVGDSVKGMLKSGETTDVEMTFHFDHLFGNFEAGENDHVNSNSPGFGFFITYMRNSNIDVTQNQMKDNPQYNRLILAIEALGHLGEGHCEIVR